MESSEGHSVNDRLLSPLLTFRHLSRDELVRRLRIKPVHIDEDRAYERLTGVAHLHNPEVSPAHFYADDTRIVMIYVSDQSILSETTSRTLTDALGDSDAVLRSRQCKRCNLHVYPNRGIAFSSDGDDIGFLEIFQPMTLEEYKQTIYREPPNFTK